MIRPDKLSTVKEAEEQPTLASSIDKWRRIESVLRDVMQSVNNQCGLCIKHDHDCELCPYGKCHDKESEFELASFAVENAISTSDDMLQALIGLEERRSE